MANQKGPAPAPLDPQVADRLLELLSSDDAFRDLFQRDAHAALVQAGYAAPEGTDPAQALALSGASCLQLAASDQLASKERFANDRQKLVRSLTLVQHFERSADFKA